MAHSDDDDGYFLFFNLVNNPVRLRAERPEIIQRFLKLLSRIRILRNVLDGIFADRADFR